MSRSNAPRSLLRMGGTLVVAYLAVVMLVWWKQDALLFFPEKAYFSLPEKLGLRHQEIRLATADGAQIEAWFVPAGTGRGRSEQPVAPKASVLFFHGNGGNLSNALFFIGELHDHGFETLAIDYHGYGTSDGRPAEKSFYLDAEAGWDWLIRDHGADPMRVVVWGHSLGGGVAAWCAEKHRHGATVLESTFTSVPDIGARLYWWLPVRLLATNVFPNLQRVPHIEGPILFAHSPADDTVPYAMGRTLFAAAREPKTWLELKGDHNNGFEQTHEAWPAVDQFLSEAKLPATDLISGASQR